MQLPLFFHDGVLEPSTEIQLDEVTAKHIFQVLRMQAGEKLMLTNGKGLSATLGILKAEKKKGVFQILEVASHSRPASGLHLAVAFTKNASRNEWLLEKAVELGVASVVPVSSERSIRERFRYDRWRNIMVSALIQSRQYYLPELTDAMSVQSITGKYDQISQKFICHCMDGYKKEPIALALQPGKETLILIGPEGDFTVEEVELAVSKGFGGLQLGGQRLRTETAAMAVCAYFNMINYEA